MSENNNGWVKPEERFPEEKEEKISDLFFEEKEEDKVPRNKKRHHKKHSGPDILAVSNQNEDDGFVIEEVVAFNDGDKLVKLKEEEKTETAEETEEKPKDEAVPSEETEEQKAATEKKPLFPNANKIISKRHHKYLAVIGAVLVALALVGAVVIISFIVRLTGRMIANAGQKEKFEWKIYPLLMFDPASFDDPGQLDEVFILKTALWSALLENKTVYSYDEQGMLIVPASDLDVAAKKLYGDSVTLNHQTFSEGYEYFYIYNEETGTYLVPVSDQTAGYTPRVAKIEKNGDIYTLIVGYVAPTTLWNVSNDGNSDKAAPDKYLYYDLQKTERGNDYIIKSVRYIPANELPDDLEVSSQQSLNQTQYIDYDALYGDLLGNVEGEENIMGEENTKEEESPEASEENTETEEN